jgi:hypothetical protein
VGEVEKVIPVQSYVVKFDMGNPVDLHINVYHEEQTKLTREEIVEEALGYAEEIGIEVTEKEVYEIIELEGDESGKKLKEEFSRLYMLYFEAEGLTKKDCEYSWHMNKEYIKSFDDVDTVIDQLCRE